MFWSCVKSFRRDTSFYYLLVNIAKICFMTESVSCSRFLRERWGWKVNMSMLWFKNDIYWEVSLCNDIGTCLWHSIGLRHCYRPSASTGKSSWQPRRSADDRIPPNHLDATYGHLRGACTSVCAWHYLSHPPNLPGAKEKFTLSTSIPINKPNKLTANDVAASHKCRRSCLEDGH